MGIRSGRTDENHSCASVLQLGKDGGQCARDGLLSKDPQGSSKCYQACCDHQSDNSLFWYGHWQYAIFNVTGYKHTWSNLFPDTHEIWMAMLDENVGDKVPADDPPWLVPASNDTTLFRQNECHPSELAFVRVIDRDNCETVAIGCVRLTNLSRHHSSWRCYHQRAVSPLGRRSRFRHASVECDYDGNHFWWLECNDVPRKWLSAPYAFRSRRFVGRCDC
jgi:hypothetical protein